MVIKHSLIVREMDWELWRCHFGASRHERMAFGFCSINTTQDAQQFLLRSVDLPTDNEYRFQGAAGVSLKAERVVARIARAKSHAALVDVHSHPFTRRPSPSTTDDEGAAKQLTALRCLAPGTKLLRMVFGQTGNVWAEVTNAERINWSPIEEIVILGLERRHVIRPVNAHLATARPLTPADERTKTVLGESSTALVRRLKVVVIGTGGVGSAVVAELRGYIDDITLIDPDVVELHNAPRLYHYAAGDAGQPKVLVHEREIRRAFPDTHVIALQASFPGGDSLELFKRADIAFCCPDHNAVRYAAAQAGTRFMKPVIEVGCGGRRENGEVAALGYHVRLQVPGAACLACNGLDLRELEDPTSSEMKRRIGYFNDDQLIAGELMPLTSRAAADAVDLLFRYVSGYTKPVPRHLYFDALRFQTIDATAAYSTNPNCTLCGDGKAALSAAGDTLSSNQQVISPPERDAYATIQ